jgi:AcrR family transcriptional regulator
MRRSSEQTKAVILAAAREQFAKAGFERATIRAIAADANIDPSMVMRYFGNKDQLFAAAADFDLQIPDLSDTERGGLGDRGGWLGRRGGPPLREPVGTR